MRFTRYFHVGHRQVRLRQPTGAEAVDRGQRHPETVPPEVLEACYSAANEIYADLVKTNPHFAKMYASLTAFRSESLAWMQVAELGYDNFMMRMRTRS